MSVTEDHATTRARETVEQNILGTVILLDACKDAKITRFIYASAVYVYSNKGGFYRYSKQATELYVEEYQNKYHIPFTILRYGTLYGPRADERNSVFRCIKQAVDDKHIIAKANGNEMREYLHVRDAAVLSADILDPAFENKHIILTGHYPMLFRQMLAMISEILGGGIEVKLEQDDNRSHYTLTPYNFIPRIGNKIALRNYTDMGQGLLECIYEYYLATRLDCNVCTQIKQ